MARDLELRCGNYFIDNLYEYPSLNEMEEPISFLLEDYPCENVPMPGLPELDPGNFPYNIENVLWSHEGEHDSEDWLMIALNTDKNFIFYKAACDYTGFDCQGFMEIYVAKDYKDLILYALTNEDYEKYINETRLMGKDKYRIKRFLENQTPSFRGNFDKEDRLIISDYRKELPYIPKERPNSNPRVILEYSIGLRKYKEWGNEFLKYYIDSHPYIYSIKYKDESITKIENENFDSGFDGYETDKEGFLVKYKKGFEMEIKYIITSEPRTKSYLIKEFNHKLK
jgi:hypothetical protein